MKKILYLFIAFALVSCKKNKEDSTEAIDNKAVGITKLRDKLYNSTLVNASDFIELSDGSVIVLGNAQKSTSFGESNLCLIKIGNDGNIIWTKNFELKDRSQSVYFVNYAYSIEKDDSDNIYINSEAEQYNSSSGTAWIIKADKDGNKIWERTFAAVSREGKYGTGNCVIAKNGTVYVLFNPWEGVQANANLAIINNNGTTALILPIPNIVYAGELKLTSDNKLIIVGVNFNESRDTKIVLTKLDLAGNIIWQKTDNSQPGDQHTHGLVEVENNFYITGHCTGPNTSQRDFLFAKFNTEGQFNSIKNFGGEFDDVGITIANVSQRLIIGGYSKTTSSPGELRGALFLNILDYEGNIKYQENLGGSGRVLSIKKSTGNTFYVLGDLGYSYRVIKCSIN
jgi:hypothetical protein